MKTTLLVSLIVAATLTSPAQGFRNLDFEMADVSNAYYLDMYGAWLVPFSEALPYWQGSPGGTAFYNGALLDGNVVGIYSRTSPVPPPNAWMPPIYLPMLTNNVIEGQFSALLMSGYDGVGGDMRASIWQTGLVPSDANSLFFKTTSEMMSGAAHTLASWDLAVFLNGQRLAAALQDFEGGVHTWAADIRAFAGATAELKFTLRSTPYDNPDIWHWGIYLGLDDIAFSPVIVPEPGGLSLLALLAVIGSCLRRRPPLIR